MTKRSNFSDCQEEVFCPDFRGRCKACLPGGDFLQKMEPPDDLLRIRRGARCLVLGAGQRPTFFTISESR